MIAKAHHHLVSFSCPLNVTSLCRLISSHTILIVLVPRVLWEISLAVLHQWASLANIDRFALRSHPAGVSTLVIPARHRCCWSRLVYHCSSLCPRQLALLQITMAHNLEQDCETNEAKIRVADQFPREAIEEADFIAHNGWWARLLAERACAVKVIGVAKKNAVRWHWVLTRHCFIVQ